MATNRSFKVAICGVSHICREQLFIFPQSNFLRSSSVRAFFDRALSQELFCCAELSQHKVCAPYKVVPAKAKRSQKKNRYSSVMQLVIFGKKKTSSTPDTDVTNSMVHESEGSIRSRREGSASSRTCFYAAIEV